jgi:cyclopropane-fatty-acyl-phospholipid synthase
MKEHRSHPLGLPAGALDREPAGSPPGRLDRWLVNRIARSVGNPPVALRLWDGTDAYRPAGSLVGRVVFHDRRALWGLATRPELAFGDGYSTGKIEVEGDLVEVLQWLFGSAERQGPGAGKRLWWGPMPRPGRNTQQGSRGHISHHYDLGNDFYRLWLDEHMVYTCAYYPRPGMSLEAAQVAKLDHVCRKVGLQPGQAVVEAGCGWGALALHMARNFGVRVRAFNISHEQIAFARERARAEGLEGQVEFVEDDYRNIEGQYDAFISVGMLEHVGREHYGELGAVIRRVLRPGGRGLIHSVGRNRPSPVNEWLERRIFPGSYPPSLGEMMAILEPGNLSVLDVENLRLHYAQTLTDWLGRFDRHADEVRSLYDDYFVRAWRLYLGGCAAAFKAGSLQLFQVVFAHGDDNGVPRSRDHLYGSNRSLAWDLG